MAELRRQAAGIQRTEQRLREFEVSYQMSTPEFVRRYENNELGETMEFAEWIGEYRLLRRQKPIGDEDGINGREWDPCQRIRGTD